MACPAGSDAAERSAAGRVRRHDLFETRELGRQDGNVVARLACEIPRRSSQKVGRSRVLWHKVLQEG